MGTTTSNPSAITRHEIIKKISGFYNDTEVENFSQWLDERYNGHVPVLAVQDDLLDYLHSRN